MTIHEEAVLALHKLGGMEEGAGQDGLKDKRNAGPAFL
jgi:hypothetical protein